MDTTTINGPDYNGGAMVTLGALATGETAQNGRSRIVEAFGGDPVVGGASCR